LARCEICKVYTQDGSEFCQRCELSLFQVTDIIKTYVEEDPPPHWLVDAIGELGWIFREYPRTKGYLNTAIEVTWMFILERLDEVGIDDIAEVNHSNLPRDKILTILEEASIITIEGEKVFPGIIVQKLRKVRWEGYQMDTPQIKSKLLELHGILTVALTQSMLNDKEYIPRRALAVFHMLSDNMINSGEKIEPVIPDYVFDKACGEMSERQKNKIRWVMSGFIDGQTKIISDVTERNGMTIKDEMVKYCEKMRERWRERDREREI